MHVAANLALGLLNQPTIPNLLTSGSATIGGTAAPAHVTPPFEAHAAATPQTLPLPPVCQQSLLSHAGVPEGVWGNGGNEAMGGHCRFGGKGGTRGTKRFWSHHHAAFAGAVQPVFKGLRVGPCQLRPHKLDMLHLVLCERGVLRCIDAEWKCIDNDPDPTPLPIAFAYLYQA